MRKVKVCKGIKKKIDDLTIDLKTGRVVPPEYLDKDELIDLVKLQSTLVWCMSRKKKRKR